MVEETAEVEKEAGAKVVAMVEAVREVGWAVEAMGEVVLVAVVLAAVDLAVDCEHARGKHAWLEKYPAPDFRVHALGIFERNKCVHP